MLFSLLSAFSASQTAPIKAKLSGIFILFFSFFLSKLLKEVVPPPKKKKINGSAFVLITRGWDSAMKAIMGELQYAQTSGATYIFFYVF